MWLLPLKRPPFPSLCTVQCYCPVNVRGWKRLKPDLFTQRVCVTHAHKQSVHAWLYSYILLFLSWPVGTHMQKYMNTHGQFSQDLLPRIRLLLESTSGTHFTPQHLACHKEKSRLASSLPSIRHHALQTGTALINGRNSAKKNTVVETQHKLQPTSSFTFLMCSIVCLWVCVHVSHLWKQLLWPPFTTSPSCSSS